MQEGASRSGADSPPSPSPSPGFSLHHIGIVCPSERHVDSLRERLGLVELSRGFVPEYQAACIFTTAPDSTTVELVVPSGGPLKEFNRGFGGLHHLAFVVPSLSELQERLEAEGVHLLESTPVRGAGNFLCNFLPPVHAGGLIVEYVELLP